MWNQMKRVLCAVLLVALFILPGLGLTEGDDTIQLARTIYTLGRDESYETKLMIGTVVMNRVENPWYPDTVREVLGQPHQFAHGTLYDDQSLQAAREVMMGRRELPAGVVELRTVETGDLSSDEKLYIISGRYGFYTK